MSRMVTLNVKSDKIMKTFKVDGRANIKFFKTKIAPEFGNPPVPQLCLIFSGKIMKDQETLDHHNIKDNQTIHLVVKTGASQAIDSRKAADYRKPYVDPRKPIEKAADPKKVPDPRLGVNVKSSPSKEDSEKEESPKPPVEEKPKIDASRLLFGLDGIYGLPKMAELGMGVVNYKELQQEMKEGIKQNPDLFKKHMESPFTQALMANPEIMRTLIQADPNTKEIVESNTTVFEMLNSPDVLRFTRETGKNPEMIQNLISKIEGNKPKSEKPSEAAKTGTKRKIEDSSFWDNKMHSLLQTLHGEKETIQIFNKIPNFAQAMFETMLENSELASKALLSIPIFADNPEIQQQMKCMIPSFLQQLQNPSTTQLMGKEYGKNAIEAIIQIQLALQRLHVVAPDLNDIMGVSNVGAGIDLFRFQSHSSAETTSKAKDEDSIKAKSEVKEKNDMEENDDQRKSSAMDEEKNVNEVQQENKQMCPEKEKDNQGEETQNLDEKDKEQNDREKENEKKEDNKEATEKEEKNKEKSQEELDNGEKHKKENAEEQPNIEKEEQNEDKEDNKTCKNSGVLVSDKKKDIEAKNDAKVGEETKTNNYPDIIDGIDAYRMLMSKAVKRMAEKGLDVRAEERFEAELSFMDEMGFKDKRTNIHHLIASCGDMHAALQSMEAKYLAKRQRS